MKEKIKNLNWQIATVILLVISLSVCIIGVLKIKSLDTLVSAMNSDMEAMTSDMEAMKNSISADMNSISSSVEEMLEQKASLFTGTDFSLSKLNKDNTTTIEVSVIPKEFTDDTTVSITISDITTELSRNGNVFSGEVIVDAFKEYGDPLISIETAKAVKTEYLDIDVSYSYSEFLPTIRNEGGSSSSYSNKYLYAELHFYVEDGSGVDNYKDIFNKYYIVEELNGKEIERKDITSDVKSKITKDNGYYNIEYNKTMSLSENDELRIYVVAEDNLGYTHKSLLYCWTTGNEAQEIIVDDSIFDKNGSILISDTY